MHINVTFFGRLKQDTGTREYALDLPRESLTLADLANLLVAHYPALGPHMDSIAYAVNDELVDLDHMLRDGDEAALLPPVSGG